MTKDTFVEEASKLPGVSKKAAEALYDAGYDTMDKVKAASEEDLLKVSGIGPKTAKAIVAGASGEETPADKVEVVESKKTKGKDAKEKKRADKGEAPAPEVVEPEAVYRPKIKAELSPEMQRALLARAIQRSHEPEFGRYHHWYAVRIPESWRAPKGTLSKQRRGFKYRPPKVKVGYGKPAITRHLHPSGFAEVMIANPAQLELITDPKTQAARIQGSVGAKKAKAIEAAAAEKKIRVLNPRRT